MQSIQHPFKINTPFIIRTTCWRIIPDFQQLRRVRINMTDKVIMMFSSSFPIRNLRIVYNGGKQENTYTKNR